MITKIKTVQEFGWLITTYFGNNFKVEEHADYFLAINETFRISLMLNTDYQPNLEDWGFSSLSYFKEHLTFDALYEEWKGNLN